MRFPLAWLSEWIDLPASEEELIERLTLGGLEIVAAERTGPDLSGVRVGHVLERRPHPSADRLSLCVVDAGEGVQVEVVCGAPNVAAGQKVALALPGTRLPDGTQLERTKIRGVVSAGMLCSDRELGLGSEHAGILVLDPDAPVGAPLASVLRAGQTVLEVEITPNRGDWASLLGMAREVRAHFGGKLRLPPSEPPEGTRSASEDVAIRIDEAEACHLYAGRVVRGVRVGPSPDWLREKLEACGMRAINVVVDVTNLVLLELGQPLHAFDLARLRGGVVGVRSARSGEEIETLDRVRRALEPGDLVIADRERPIAIAGVMGGTATEVGPHTADVLIESAHFHASRVRRTARRLGLHTEASYRFERGVDRSGVERAADRAARLLAELAGGTVSRGAVVARGSEPPAQGAIALDPTLPDRRLGTRLSPEEITSILARLDIRAELGSDGRLRCAVPSYRNDLAIPEDLVEEIGRIHGFDRIEATLPVGPLQSVETPALYALADGARDALTGAGLLEMRSFPGMRAEELDALGLAASDRRREVVRILNPIQEEEGVLRPSLLPALLRAVRGNLDRQVDGVRLYEVARVFLAKGDGELPEERLTAAGALTARERPGLWEPREPVPVFFAARAAVQRALEALGFEVWLGPGRGEPYLHPGAAAEIRVAQRVVGVVGELHPRVARAFEIGAPCAVFEVDLATLVELPRRVATYREVSRQPAVRRDIAVLVDRAQWAGELLEAVRRTAGETLVQVEVFDRYEGKGIPEGKVSLAFRLVLQRPDRTLTDAEVGKVVDRVVRMLAQRFGAVQR